ncbi:hypothetical protein K491DRAFT_688944 [Lophiostoma macrostomum CBS 122681]|uniref:Translation initiation factor 3 N-terminal domain-containing protein n=1 Tax=Lophiostoma macrostomum CBS 122681 TaxID=1314788 RepID=A0A6A6TK85_9PLEO|nr:hypothetical protein K491DRAFT_688944 [Lophiostoma macrostomum CBS 122681]
MPPYHLSSTSRALYRVFILPSLSHPPTPLRLPQPISVSIPRTCIRTKVWGKDTSRHALSDHYTIDNAITAPVINLIDLDGKYYENVPLSEALSSFPRMQNHLLQVSAAEEDEDGGSVEGSVPTCKVVPRMQLRLQHQRKLDIERRQKQGQGAGPGAKNLELNWAIAGGDLSHRLEKLREFLREGRKVEVMIGPKRRGKKASDEECQSMMEAVRSAVEDVKGAREVKQPDGVMGDVMTLTFEGKESEETQQKTIEEEEKEDDEEEDLNQIKSKRLRKQKERERKAKKSALQAN